MQDDSLVFTATGDSFITAGLPVRDAEFHELAEVIKSADVRFTNLEVVVREDEGYPAQISGGTWGTARPEVLNDLKDYGFNLIAWANNHTLDYLHGGLEATRKYLNAAGFVHAGAGLNLAEAAAVRYLDCGKARVAMIAACSSYPSGAVAGDQRPDCAGRPGLNPLRFTEVVKVEAQVLEQLRQLAGQTGINDRRELSIKEGFTPADPEGVLVFGDSRFEIVGKGETPGRYSKAAPRDLERMKKAIHEAVRSADYVVVSIHCHEFRDGRKDLPASFLEEFARCCIDAGVHAVIGHGPHILRGIEIYQGRPIFYSLGDFIFQNDAVAVLPADFYEKYGLGHDATVSDGLDKRSDNGKRGLATDPRVWHSVLPRWTMRDGQLESLELIPLTLGFGESRWSRGRPRVTPFIEPLKEIISLSAEYGTAFDIRGNQAVWRRQ